MGLCELTEKSSSSNHQRDDDGKREKSNNGSHHIFLVLFRISYPMQVRVRSPLAFLMPYFGMVL